MCDQTATFLYQLLRRKHSVRRRISVTEISHKFMPELHFGDVYCKAQACLFFLFVHLIAQQPSGIRKKQQK